jgi:putative transposase
VRWQRRICSSEAPGAVQERKVKPRRAGDATRWIMATLSQMFTWRDALWDVKPDTLIRWHRKGFRLFWRWKSTPAGRHALPKSLRKLIREIAAAKVTWGEERIANELNLKLGIRVSPRTARRIGPGCWSFSGVEAPPKK